MPPSLPAGVGLMRLSTAPDRDEARGIATIHAALEAGVRLFDTAPSYAHGEDDLHHNERLLARALRSSGVPRSEITVVTKVGLTRRGTEWVPDGRASAIEALARASHEALEGEIDILLLHCVDPRVKLETSVRALAGLRDAGLTRAIGLSEVGHNGLRRALDVTTIAAVEERLGAFDDRPLRTGLVELAQKHGAFFLAHTPLGTPARVAKLALDPTLRSLADRYETHPATLVLAWLAAHGVVALPGVSRPETAREAGRVPGLAAQLSPDELDTIAHAIGARPREAPAATTGEGEIVIVMGVQGAGKSRLVSTMPGLRLNRDERGGTMKKLHRALGAALEAGERRFVLDNTYPTRAVRAEVVDLARRFGVPVRCVLMDTPLPDAQVNVVLRMLDRHGDLLSGEALRRASKDDPGVFLPTAQHKYLRELEPPDDTEGFAKIERVPFERAPSGTAPGRIVALELAAHLAPSDVPTLALAWSPPDAPADPAHLDAARARAFEIALCEHPAGPPTCWCRPPLPGLPVRWMRAHRIDPARSTFHGHTRAHRTMAEALRIPFAPA